MTLKAVLFDFNGVIIHDEPIHQELITQILLQENLRPSVEEFREVCLGRSDRIAIRDILARRGRVVTDEYLMQLIQRKTQAYRQQIDTLKELPSYPGLKTFAEKVLNAGLVTAVVTGALRSEVELVLDRLTLSDYFPVIVAGDDISVSKPEPEGYLLALEKLKEHYRDLNLQASECLVIEDAPAGIEAAKRAGMQVLGIANSYPFHMLQRQTNWCVDYFRDIELDRIQQVFSGTPAQASAS